MRHPTLAVRRRRGSVIILAVALIVILALIATAYLASSRTDRQGSSDSTRSAQADMLLDSMASIVRARLAETPSANGRLGNQFEPGFANTDSFLSDADALLAPRTPFRVGVAGDPPAPTGWAGGPPPLTLLPYWRTLSWPLVGPTGINPRFAVPFPTAAGAYTANRPLFAGPFGAPNATPFEDLVKSGLMFQPVAITLNAGTVVPALQLTNKLGQPLDYATGVIGALDPFVAADADGDGIADAGLFELPGGSVPGFENVRWYGAMRLIDNNSAINAAVANEPGPVPGGNVFPTNVNLFDLLRTDGAQNRADQLVSLNRYRFTANTADDNSTVAVPLNTALVPTESGAAVRANDQFTSPDDLVWSQLGRRLDNPGFYPEAVPAQRMSGLPASDSIALASGFVLASNAGSPGSIIEGSDDLTLGGRLRSSIVEQAPNSAYTPNDLGNWFDDSFAYSDSAALPVANTVSIRSILTTRNPVAAAPAVGVSPPNDAMLPTVNAGEWDGLANYSTGDVVTYTPAGPYVGARQPGVYPMVCVIGGTTAEPVDAAGALAVEWALIRPRGVYTGGAYAPGNAVTHFNTVTGTQEVFIYLAAGNWLAANLGVQGYAAPTDLGRAQPAVNKAAVNSAGFAELFRAFWQPMAAFGRDEDYNRNGILDPGEDRNGNGGPPDPGLSNPVAQSLFFGSQFYGIAPPPPEPVFGPVGEDNNLRMFRSSIRDPRPTPVGDESRTVLTLGAMKQLRAAIAAINAIDLRDPDTQVSYRDIYLPAVHNVAGATKPGMTGNVFDDDATDTVRVRVFGNEPQAFITEVYLNTDTWTDTDPTAINTDQNVNGYVAIELHNPTNVTIDLTNWRIGFLNRTAGVTGYAVAGYDVDGLSFPLPAALVSILPGQTIVLESYDPLAAVVAPATTPPGFRPKALHTTGEDLNGNAILDPGEDVNGNGLLDPGASYDNVITGFYSVPGLTRATGQGLAQPFELILFRPVIGATGTTISDLFAPVDSFDFSGVLATLPPPLPGDPLLDVATNPVPPTTEVREWHYARVSGGWQVVYPGRYDGLVTTGPARQQGTFEQIYPVTYIPEPDVNLSGGWDPPDDVDGSTTYTYIPPQADLSPVFAHAPALSFGVDNTAATYPVASVRTIQLNAGITTLDPAIAGAFGPNPPTFAGPYAFPNGGFTRDLDVLHVPFIGAYAITLVDPATGLSTDLVEVNPVTLDAAMAEDTLLTDDADEQIGRFWPVGDADDVVGATPDQRYGWAHTLFDYVTVLQNPHSDRTPNVSADGSLYPPSAVAGDEPEAVANIVLPPGAVGSRGNGANGARERALGTNGLININTANWRVLGALPWVLAGDNLAIDVNTGVVGVGGGDGFDDNMQIGQAIARYRDGDGSIDPIGPFRGPLDLMRVPAIESLGVQIGTLGPEPDDADGDTSPVGGGTDLVRDDFEERALVINRVSNMITTRSDTYTCYLLVQGWQDVGTEDARPVFQKRAAFIVDRSGVGDGSSPSRDVKVMQVPVPAR